jgi:hypothetical protein
LPSFEKTSYAKHPDEAFVCPYLISNSEQQRSVQGFYRSSSVGISSEANHNNNKLIA